MVPHSFRFPKIQLRISERRCKRFHTVVAAFIVVASRPEGLPISYTVSVSEMGIFVPGSALNHIDLWVIFFFISPEGLLRNSYCGDSVSSQ